MCVGWLVVSHRQQGHSETAPPHLLFLEKDVKLGFYTVHYTTAAPRQLHCNVCTCIR